MKKILPLVLSFLILSTNASAFEEKNKSTATVSEIIVFETLGQKIFELVFEITEDIERQFQVHIVKLELINEKYSLRRLYFLNKKVLM